MTHPDIAYAVHVVFQFIHATPYCSSFWC